LIPFLKRLTVFNSDQCEMLPAELVTAPPSVPEGLTLPQVEALIAATGADFRIGGDRALHSRMKNDGRRPGLTPVSSRSTGTGPHSTGSVTLSDILHAWLATCQA
jgi:hypothetical protein